MKCLTWEYSFHPRGRSPYGERGLKYHLAAACPTPGSSLPLRGAWIEIEMKIYKILLLLSLPLRGAWIEMDYINISTPKGGRRSPYGERGLKYRRTVSIDQDDQSLPLRGAWIEIVL